MSVAGERWHKMTDDEKKKYDDMHAEAAKV